MGTNYYAKIEECRECGRHEKIHLGKSSAGWVFSFQYNGGKYYKNAPEMKEWLKDKKIRDEYNRNVEHKDFWKLVDAKQSAPNNHAEQYPSDTEYVIDGYSFSDVDFS